MLALFAGAAVGTLMLIRPVMVPLCVCGIMSIVSQPEIRAIRIRVLPGMTEEVVQWLCAIARQPGRCS